MRVAAMKRRYFDEYRFLHSQLKVGETFSIEAGQGRIRTVEFVRHKPSHKWVSAYLVFKYTDKQGGTVELREGGVHRHLFVLIPDEEKEKMYERLAHEGILT